MQPRKCLECIFAVCILQEMNSYQQTREFCAIWVSRQVAEPNVGMDCKTKSLPYISLNADLAKMRIERKIVPFSLFLKLNKKCKRKSPNQKGQGFIVI